MNGRYHKVKLEVIDKIQELNKGWRPDWNDEEQKKYYFEYHRHPIGTPKIFQNYTETIGILKDEFYFKSREIGCKLIKELGTNKIKLALWPSYEEAL